MVPIVINSQENKDRNVLTFAENGAGLRQQVVDGEVSELHIWPSQRRGYAWWLIKPPPFVYRVLVVAVDVRHVDMRRATRRHTGRGRRPPRFGVQINRHCRNDFSAWLPTVSPPDEATYVQTLKCDSQFNACGFFSVARLPGNETLFANDIITSFNEHRQ